MRSKLFFVIFTFVQFFALGELMGQKIWEDTSATLDRLKVDSIIRSFHQNGSFSTVADDGTLLPDGGRSAVYVFDSLTKKLISALVVTHRGKIKRMTYLYFLSDTLIAIDDGHVPLENQTSSKYRKFDRYSIYWSGRMIWRLGYSGNFFNDGDDFERARIVISRFKRWVQNGKLSH